VLAADTNVVVRLLVGDSPGQQRAVLARLRRVRADGESVLLGAVVLAEIAWVLAAAYGYQRPHIVTALRGLLATPPFVVAARPAVTRALASYEHGAADFADYLILELGREEGATKLLTFDKRLQKDPACEAP
jgi:predicted nucleic-acid-binding protein